MWCFHIYCWMHLRLESILLPDGRSGLIEKGEARVELAYSPVEYESFVLPYMKSEKGEYILFIGAALVVFYISDLGKTRLGYIHIGFHRRPLECALHKSTFLHQIECSSVMCHCTLCPYPPAFQPFPLHSSGLLCLRMLSCLTLCGNYRLSPSLNETVKNDRFGPEIHSFLFSKDKKISILINDMSVLSISSYKRLNESLKQWL